MERRTILFDLQIDEHPTVLEDRHLDLLSVDDVLAFEEPELAQGLAIE